MPELDLREALNDLTDEVTVVDLLSRVEHRLIARRRNRAISAGLATLLIIVGAVAAATTLRDSAGRSLPPVSPQPSTPTPTTGKALASESVLPSWLPTGASLAGQNYLQPPSRSRTNPDWKPVPHSWYRIDGPANANTIPPGGITAGNATTVHPETTIDISFNPNLRTMPPVPTHPSYFHRRDITIAGNPALISIPNDGYGAFRIDWVDSAGYHAIMCDRLKTPEGRSGVPMSDLVHMARSLYAAAGGSAPDNPTDVGFTVGYIPSGFEPVVDIDAAGPPPAGITRLAFQSDDPADVRRSFTVELWRVDDVSDVATFAHDNGHLRLTQIGGRQGAVGWNVPQHQGQNGGVHLAYVVLRPGVAIQVTEVDSPTATALTDDELVRIAASVQLPLGRRPAVR